MRDKEKDFCNEIMAKWAQHQNMLHTLAALIDYGEDIVNGKETTIPDCQPSLGIAKIITIITDGIDGVFNEYSDRVFSDSSEKSETTE